MRYSRRTFASTTTWYFPQHLAFDDPHNDFIEVGSGHRDCILTVYNLDIRPRAEMNTLLPKQNRLESFWLSERDPSLSHLRSSETLPTRADIVIVGSGISGALIAREIYARWKEQGENEDADGLAYPTVVMLEAGETCGGATARNGKSLKSLDRDQRYLNETDQGRVADISFYLRLSFYRSRGSRIAILGGHCKPLTYLGFRSERLKRGAKIANAMYDFEGSHLSRYVRIVQEEGLDCDLVVTRAFDVLFDPSDAENAKKDYDSRREMFPESIKQGDVVSVEDPEELERLSGVRGGKWGCHYPAGHLWPYKLATQRE
jgi:glycine/D-amino acid oxidase-like deaminating enzyme